MKIAKTNHYLMKTDVDMLVELANQLEQDGLTNLEQINERLNMLGLRSFSDLFAFAAGSGCDNQLAIILEDIFDRLGAVEINRPEILTSSGEIGSYLAAKLKGRRQEEFWALYIDNGNHIVAEKRIFLGTLDKALVHPREILRWAMIYGCAGIVIVHNHPSGKLEPSPADLAMTTDIAEATDLMRIKLMDHFIVGKGKYFSLMEHNLL